MKPAHRHNLPITSVSGKRRLCFAITAHLMAAAAHAGPSGGEIVGGDGAIEQSGLITTINQLSDRLAIDWQSFNVAADERVTFLQPNQNAIALNRILGSEGSQILGRIDANGHVILMNPNGVFFGADSVVNVGGLVATGLNIETSDFLNGELLLEAVAGTAGTVINEGIINAASGGNVAFIGTQVTNSGLISARLGHVALVSGQQAVVTFDDQGMLGVAIDRETLQSQLGDSAGVINTGKINAESGRILLSGSVSQDLFSRAVNSGGMNSGGGAIVHDDGSFTLGASVDVVNSGQLNVTGKDNNRSAGEVILVGRDIAVSGTIAASHTGTGAAGNIHLQSQGARVSLTGNARVQAMGSNGSGTVLLAGDTVTAGTSTRIDTIGDTTIYSDTRTQTAILRTRNATLRSSGTITQSRSMKVSENLHLQVSGGQTTLTHELNDIHQLSADINDGANVTLSDSTDLQLGDIHISNATAKITAANTLSQGEGSTIGVHDGLLWLRGGNLDFSGENSSTINLTDSHLNAHFTGEAKLLNVDIAGVNNTSRVYLSTPGERGFTTLGRAGFQAHVWYQDQEADGAGGLHIEKLNSLNTKIYSAHEVTQGGAIYNDGALNLHLKDGGAVYFNNSGNQLRRANLNLSSGSSVQLVNAKSLSLGDIQAEQSAIQITALAAGAKIWQAGNTTISLNHSTAAVTADNVLLGQNTNNSLQVNDSSKLDVNFTQQAHVVDTGSGNLGNNTQVTGTYTAGRVNVFGSGGSQFHFNATTYENGITIHGLTATDLIINGAGKLFQNRAIKLKGALQLNISDIGSVTFDNPENDFNRVDMNLNKSSIRLVDANNIIIGDLNLTSGSQTWLTALSLGAAITQAENTTVSLDNSNATLYADRILLGHHDNSVLVRDGRLNASFREYAHVVGERWGKWPFISVSRNNDVITLAASSQPIELGVVNNFMVYEEVFGEPYHFNAHVTSEGVNIIKTTAQGLGITSNIPVRQSGPIQLSRHFGLNLSAGSHADITHALNDFVNLSAYIRDGASLILNDPNNLQLGQIQLFDNSTANITAAGALGHAEFSGIAVVSSTLNLQGKDLNFDFYHMNSHTDIRDGEIRANFINSAKFSPVYINDIGHISNTGRLILNALDEQHEILGSFEFSSTGAPSEESPIQIDVRREDNQLNIGILAAKDASISNSIKVQQRGPIVLSGTLYLKDLRDDMNLYHYINPIHRLDISSAHNSRVLIYAADDIHLGNWNLDNSFVDIRAFRSGSLSGSSIRQAANSHIKSVDSHINLLADGIALGADGTSSIEIDKAGSLNATFLHQMHIDGEINFGPQTGFFAKGNSANNTLTIGEHATFNPLADFSDVLIDLVGGANTFHLYQNLPGQTRTGSGPNTINVHSPDIDPISRIVDFDPEKDRIVFVP